MGAGIRALRVGGVGWWQCVCDGRSTATSPLLLAAARFGWLPLASTKGAARTASPAWDSVCGRPGDGAGGDRLPGRGVTRPTRTLRPRTRAARPPHAARAARARLAERARDRPGALRARGRCLGRVAPRVPPRASLTRADGARVRGPRALERRSPLRLCREPRRVEPEVPTGARPAARPRLASSVVKCSRPEPCLYAGLRGACQARVKTSVAVCAVPGGQMRAQSTG
jgi:hypothetical protein